MSRARLGLYVFCRRSLFEQCYELQPTFQLLLKRPDRLGLNLSENASAYTDRAVEEVGNPYLVHDVEEMAHIVHDRMNEFYKAQGVYEQYQNHTPQIEDGNHDMESDTVVGEDGDSEKKTQPELDGVVDESSSKETVAMEVDNGVSGEKADEN